MVGVIEVGLFIVGTGVNYLRYMWGGCCCVLIVLVFIILRYNLFIIV